MRSLLRPPRRSLYTVKVTRFLGWTDTKEPSGFTAVVFPISVTDPFPLLFEWLGRDTESGAERGS